jgi:hypothetical protein
MDANRGRPLLPSCMLVYVDRTALDIVNMPRGGPDASWLDRRLQTKRLEYLDRDDVDDLKRKVIRSLDRSGRRRFLGAHEVCAKMALPGYTASPQGPDNYFETASAACGGYLRLR